MKETGAVYIGIDVSKGTLDIDAGDLGVLKVANTAAGVRKALAGLARKAGAGVPLHVCMEATGPYIRTLVAGCRSAGLPCSILDPHRVALFARSLSHAKTDRIDASVIRRFAQQSRPAPWRPPSGAAAKVDRFLLARDTLVESLGRLRNVLGTLRGSPAAKPLEKAAALMEKQVAGLDRLIAEAVAGDAGLAGLTAALASVTGVGALTAAKVAVWMPEVGTLGRRGAAALAGLAPHTRESGKWRGKSFTGGGRKCVRDALYMPATSARRSDPYMRRVYEGLRARGKIHKVAQTAVMRRLICSLEAAAKAYYAGLGNAPA